MVQRNSQQGLAPRSRAGAVIASHTPTPWTTKQFDFTAVVYGPDKIQVVSTSWHGSIRATYPLKAESLANAAFIVKAVNAHDALVKALADIIEANKDFRDGMPQSWDGDPLQDACDAAKTILEANL